MVVDSSALLAILQDEPERRAMIETLESADRRCLSVVNLVEASVVIETRRGPAAARLLDTLVERAANQRQSEGVRVTEVSKPSKAS